MTKYLVLRFISLASPVSVRWAVVDSAGHLQKRGENLLSELPDILIGEQMPSTCILLVPSEKIRITQVQIPSSNPKKIRQALPFSVEELIADELETTHLATGAIHRNNNGIIDVAIVRHELIIEWIDLCHQYHIIPHYIIPDALCVPWEENSWSLFFEKGITHPRVLLRTGPMQAQAVSASLASVLLHEMTLTSNKRQEIIVKPQVNFYASEADAELFKQWRQSLPQTPDHDQRDVLFREDIFEVMSAQVVLQLNTLINLRQGGYRVPVDARRAGKSTRQMAMLAVAGCVLFAMVCIGKGLWYNLQRAEIDQQAVALYKQIYPDATRIFSPRRQMEAAISGGDNAAADDDVFLDTLVDVTQVITSSQNAEVYIQSLLFNAEQPESVSMSMVVSQADALDEMRERLTEADIKLDVGKTIPAAKGVAVDFRLLRDQ
jgi:general secretion pathway protein L